MALSAFNKVISKPGFFTSEKKIQEKSASLDGMKKDILPSVQCWLKPGGKQNPWTKSTEWTDEYSDRQGKDLKQSTTTDALSLLFSFLCSPSGLCDLPRCTWIFQSRAKLWRNTWVDTGRPLLDYFKCLTVHEPTLGPFRMEGMRHIKPKIISTQISFLFAFSSFSMLLAQWATRSTKKYFGKCIYSPLLLILLAYNSLHIRNVNLNRNGQNSP